MFNKAFLLLYFAVFISTFYVESSYHSLASHIRSSGIIAFAKVTGERNENAFGFWRVVSSPYSISVTVDSQSIPSSYCINEIEFISMNNKVLSSRDNLELCGKLFSVDDNSSLQFYRLGRYALEEDNFPKTLNLKSSEDGSLISFELTIKHSLNVKNWLYQMFLSA